MAPARAWPTPRLCPVCAVGCGKDFLKHQSGGTLAVLLMATELSPQIALHLGTVITAIVLGAVQLALPKGTSRHRAMGRVWAVLMLAAAVSSFWIRRDGYSWIHGLSMVTIVSVGAGVAFARLGLRRAHVDCMIGAFSGAIGAGVGALAPGRFLHALLFSG